MFSTQTLQKTTQGLYIECAPTASPKKPKATLDLSLKLCSGIDLNIPIPNKSQNELSQASVDGPLPQQSNLNLEEDQIFCAKHQKKRSYEQLADGEDIENIHGQRRAKHECRLKLNTKIDHESEASLDDESEASLVLVGCVRCYVYIMVPKTSLRCPWCHNKSVLDLFK